MSIHIISSITPSGAMGYQNQLIHRDARDLTYFRSRTLGNIVIMGRLTYESIGHPLPDRTTLVITSAPIDGVPCFPTLLAALQFASHYPYLDTYIIGGPRLFTEALDQDWVDFIHLTTFTQEATRADTFFPVAYLLDPKWKSQPVADYGTLSITKLINTRLP